MKGRRTVLIGIILLVSTLLMNGVNAATYYVDKNHPQANDSNPGTAARPWETIGKATATMIAGDTALVRAGTYTEPQSGTRHVVGFFNSGTEGNLITLMAYPGDSVVLDAQHTRTYGIELNGTDYIRIQGLEIINTNTHGILTWDNNHGQGHEIIGNNIHDCGIGNTNSAGVYYRYAGSGLIEGNHIHHNGGDGIYFTSDSGMLVRNNEINHNDVDAIKCAGRGEAIIEGNYLHDYVAGGHHEDGIQFMGTQGIIRNNLVGDMTQDIYIDTYSATPGARPRKKIFIYNNICYNSTPGSSGIEGNVNGIVIDHRDNTIGMLYVCHNTLIFKNNGSGGFRHLGTDYNIDTLVVKNNLFYNSIVMLAPGGTVYAETDYNLYYNEYRTWYLSGWVTLPEYQASHPGFEEHSFYADPLLADIAGRDFHLRSGSPAINAGTPLAPVGAVGFYYDRDSTVRPQDGAWDVGAYEYKSINVQHITLNVQLPSPVPALQNPWVPATGYEIMNLTGGEESYLSINAGVYLVRKPGESVWARVTVVGKL